MSDSGPLLATRTTDRPTHADDVIDLAVASGAPLFDWQAAVMAQACEYETTATGWRWARGLVIVICPRRNGKTALILWRVLAGVLLWGERSITYTAHSTDTALETFRALATILMESPLLSQYVARVYFTNGKERLVFTNGAVFSVRTRTKSGGRGLESDCLIIDEGLELQGEHEDVLLALLAKAELEGRGQLFVLSSAGHGGSERLQHYRDQGRAACTDPDPRICYIEYAAPRGIDLDDRQWWRRANPSLGLVVSETFLERQHLLLSAEAFGREHLGWWTEQTAAPFLPAGSWELCATAPPDRTELVGRPVLALEMQQGCAAILVGAFRLTSGAIWVDCLGVWAEPAGLNLPQVARDIRAIAKESKPAAMFATPFTAAPLLDQLRGVTVHQIAAAQFRDASVGLMNAVTSATIRHSGDRELSDVATAGAAISGDGVAILSRKNSPGFSCAAVAVALAVRGVTLPQPRPGVASAAPVKQD